MNAARAYANARIHGAKSRLLTRADVMPLMIAEDRASAARALATLGIDAQRPLFPQLFARLVGVYRTAIRAYRGEADILRLMLRLHEIENLKLAWRAVTRKELFAVWRPLWRELDEFAVLHPARIRGIASPHDLTERLTGTPYGRIAASVESAHGADLAAAELAFDRWGAAALLDAARRLPPHEALARQLVESVVRDRAADLLRRGERIYGFSSAALEAMSASMAVPPSKTSRKRLVARAFVGRTFELSPAIALVLLAEEELRGVNALAECGSGKARAAAERIVVEGAMAT